MEISVKVEPLAATGPAPAPEQVANERGVKPEVVANRSELIERLKPDPGFTPIVNRITAQHRKVELIDKASGQKALVFAFSGLYEAPDHPGANWITVTMDRSAPLLMDSDTFELIKDQEYTMVNSNKYGVMRIDVLTEPGKASNFTKRGTPRCAYCDTRAGQKRCPDCKLVRYCSDQCQRKHWTERHAGACKRLAEVTLAPAPKTPGITPEQAVRLGAVSADKLSRKLRDKVAEESQQMDL